MDFDQPDAGVPSVNRRRPDIRIQWKDIKVESKPSSSLYFLGLKNVIYDRAVHLIAAHAKTGKTTLLFHLVREWRDGMNGTCPKILWISEEAKETWAFRKDRQDMMDMPISIIEGFSHPTEDLLEQACLGDEQIVIIDTASALMGVEDENSNSIVTRVLKIWITALRMYEKTVIIVHHMRKSEGDNGLAIAGATAWRRMVDMIMEVDNVAEHPERRKISFSGRYPRPAPITYELVDGFLVRLT